MVGTPVGTPVGSPAGRPAWGGYVAVAVVVAAVAVVVTTVVLWVTLPTMLCQRDTGSVVVGDSAGGATQLKEALAKVARLQEQNQLLRTQVAEQQQQLEELQTSRDTIQLENELLKKQLRGTKSADGDGCWLFVLVLLAALFWKWCC